MRYFLTLLSLGLFVSFVANSEPPTQSEKEKYIIEDVGFDHEFESPIPIKDGRKAVIFGMLLYTMDNSCATCHPVVTGGQPTQDRQFAIGRNADFEEMAIRHGMKLKLDQQNKKTPEVVNARFLENALWFCEAGKGGFNEGLSRDSLIKLNPNNAYGYSGRLTQILTAQSENAHNIGSQVEKIRKDTFFLNLAKEAFYTSEINLLVSASAIGIYEQMIVPTQSNYQLWLRGLSDLKEPKGYDLFKKNCVQCHSGPAFGNEQMREIIGESDFVGRNGLVKVPQLYQKKDAKTMFHSSEKLSIYKAIKKHELGLKPKTIREIRKFITNDLQDKDLKRYLEF